METDSEALIRAYFKAIERGVAASELAAFLHEDIRQCEFPSRLNPQGRTRGKAEMLADFERGKSLLAGQEYRIRSLVVSGDRVCAETGWKGTLAVPLGPLKAGDAMQADFGVFFTLREGKIVEQNNYDCIHPW